LLDYILIIAGLVLIVFANAISRIKTEGWAAFYRKHPHAAAANPLSGYAGSEKSKRLGSFMWRLNGALLIFLGLLRLLTAHAK